MAIPTQVLLLDDAQLQLIDQWPGIPTMAIPFPPDLTQWSTTEDYPVGTKIVKRDPDNNGDSTFIYLKLIKGTTDVNVVVKDVVGQDNIPATAGVWSDVTNDGGDVFLNGPIAVALAALDYGVALATTTYRYGWFWCGGVCPTGLVKNAAGEKILDGDFTIDDAVTAGNGLKLADNADIACTLATKAAGDLTPAAGRCNATVTGS